MRVAETGAQDRDEFLARMNEEMRGAEARVILSSALSMSWDGRIGYVCSFGAESPVLLTLIAEIDPALEVVFIDTHRHFPQTLDYRDELISRLGLTGVRTVSPGEAESRVLDPDGRLWRSDPDACCALRKVRPLDAALTGMGAWITGRKRFHGGERVRLPVFEYSAGRFKVNPLASWRADQTMPFLQARGIPAHPLVERGYLSIGCWPCTVPAEGPADLRSGRWPGREKTECGLHVDAVRRPAVF